MGTENDGLAKCNSGKHNMATGGFHVNFKGVGATHRLKILGLFGIEMYDQGILSIVSKIFGSANNDKL